MNTRFATLQPCSKYSMGNYVWLCCKATKRMAVWTTAVAEGWVADTGAPAFSAYYSPEGFATLCRENCRESL